LLSPARAAAPAAGTGAAVVVVSPTGPSGAGGTGAIGVGASCVVAKLGEAVSFARIVKSVPPNAPMATSAAPA
jgi:hypothetical protein